MVPLKNVQPLCQSLRGTMKFSSLVPLTGLASSRETGMGIWSRGAASKEKEILTTAVSMPDARGELGGCSLPCPTSHGSVRVPGKGAPGSASGRATGCSSARQGNDL